jgi:hypothetical protein
LRRSFTPGAAIILILLSTFDVAQTATTSLRGTISDPQEAVVSWAKVTLSNPSTGFSQSTETDDHGFYQFLQVPPGTYNLAVLKQGFSSLIEQNLQLLVNVPTTSNLTLRVQGQLSTVEVESTAVEVNSQDATIGNAFGARQIESLPFEGRDPTQILSLQPGVSFVGTNVDQDYDSRGGAVNGARSDQTDITLDGIDDNDQVKGYAFEGALRSTLDSLQEFRVTTSNANADAGRSSGAQVALVTKSGTNNFHGSVYEYNRNNLGYANDWFNKRAELQSGLPNVPGQLIRNTFGATTGGPIVKDRLFFFLAYEGQRTRENVQTTQVVPSDNLREGMISYECTGDPQCPANGVETLTRQDLAIMDPNCTANGTCPLGPGANPAVMAVFQQYPHANSTTVGDGLNFLGFTFPASTPGMLNTYVAKFDFNISTNHHVFVRGGMVDDNQGAGPEFPGQPQSSVALNNSKGIIAAYTATLRPTLINNFRYGLIRQGVANVGQIDQPYVFFGEGPTPLYALTNTTRSTVPVHNLVDDLAWVRGRHTLQFGENVRIITDNRISNVDSFSYARTYTLWLTPTSLIAGQGGSLDPGAFGFPAVNPNFQTGYDWPVIALTGLVDSGFAAYNVIKTGAQLPVGVPAVRHFRANEFETYVEDSWRTTPQLTLTYGVRYTLLQPPYESAGNEVVPSINMEDFLLQRGAAMLQGQTYTPPISFILGGKANNGPPYWNWDYGNVAPRLAFAWSPKADSGRRQRLFGASGKSSIRGGWGMYYDHFGEATVDSFDRNGSFGLNGTIQNPIGEYTIDTSPRFSGLNSLPSGDLVATPTGAFPKIAPSGLPEGVTTSWGLDNRMKTPYSYVFDFTVSRELKGDFVLEASYIGRLGRRLLQEEDLAMPLDLVDPKSHVDYFTAATKFSKMAAAGTPVAAVNTSNAGTYWEDTFPVNGQFPGSQDGLVPVSQLIAAGGGCGSFPLNNLPPNITVTQAMYDAWACNVHNETLPLIFADVPGYWGIPNACYPLCPSINGRVHPYAFFDSQFSSLYAWRNAGTSSYNGLQITLRHGLSHGLQWDFNYTYSKSIDIGSEAERVNAYDAYYQANQIINSWSPAQLRGVSDWDTTHQFNTNWVYDLPVGRGKTFAASSHGFVNTLIGGWQWSGLARWTSGFPTTVETYTSFPTNWYLPSTAILSGPKPTTGTFTDQFGNPDLFKNPAVAQGDFRYSYPGESGQRNELRGPGFFGIDTALGKSWRIHESQSLKFTWDIYNVTNSVRFDVAPLVQTTSLLEEPASVFGTYSSTLTKPRVMEWALRYSF